MQEEGYERVKIKKRDAKYQYIVSSIQGFLAVKEKINNPDKQYQLFYRGLSDELYAKNDIPGIFREQKNHPEKRWIENEDEMFFELVSEKSESFKDCKTIFEHLVVMQHYEYPTRLLDITSNPLIALYFACGGFEQFKGNEINQEKDGRLMIYQIKRKDIRNYDSDRVILLANLAISKDRLRYEYFLLNEIQNIADRLTNINERYSSALSDQSRLEKEIGFSYEILQRKIKKCLKGSRFIDKQLSYYIRSHNSKKSTGKKNSELDHKKNQERKDSQARKANERSRYNYLKKVKKQLRMICKLSKRDFSPKRIRKLQKSIEELAQLMQLRSILFSAPYFGRYCYLLEQEKNAFKGRLIKSKHLKEVQCVIPKKNNPRILAQHGAFLIFGMAKKAFTKNEVPKIPRSLYAKGIDNGEDIGILTIKISGEHKQKILDELALLGISDATVFPEISAMAATIKRRFEAKKALRK